jgi:transposase
MTDEILQANATNPPTSAPTRLLVAMEMSLKTWRLVMAPEGGSRKRVKAVEAGNYQDVEQAVADARARFQLPAETRVVFCYEAGRDGFYPHRRLTAEGHEVWVIDSASIEVSRRQKQAKSDGIDGDKLAELMQRQARGERKALRIVRVPPPEAEDQRLLPRERENLLQDVGRLRNQIESILFAHGYREVPKTAGALQSWVEARPDLPPHLRERLGREIERLGLLETQCQTVEKALAQQVREDHGAGIAAVAWSLMQLCGIGLIGAWVLAAELFGWRRFRNRREVGAVLGLTPTPYSSGRCEREQGISKAGNRRARAMLVELAWLWLRYQPDSALARWFQTRFGGGGKRMRRIGIVALARRLAVALWRYTARGIVPEGAKLKPVAPG